VLSWYRWEGADLVLNLRVQPRARRDEFAEPFGDQIKVRITAPPVEGKANAHLLRFVADLCEVPLSQVSLLAGGQNRSKRLRIVAPRRLPAGVSAP
jgi:uncharacterized protein (TIGR00251 family)